MASEVLCMSVSRRILLSKEINLYRELAYLIEEEISNMTLHSVCMKGEKCTSLMGQWQL